MHTDARFAHDRARPGAPRRDQRQQRPDAPACEPTYNGRPAPRTGLPHRHLRQVAPWRQLPVPPAGSRLRGDALVPLLAHRLRTGSLGQQLLRRHLPLERQTQTIHRLLHRHFLRPRHRLDQAQRRGRGTVLRLPADQHAARAVLRARRGHRGDGGNGSQRQAAAHDAPDQKQPRALPRDDPQRRHQHGPTYGVPRRVRPGGKHHPVFYDRQRQHLRPRLFSRRHARPKDRAVGGRPPCAVLRALARRRPRQAARYRRPDADAGSAPDAARPLRRQDGVRVRRHQPRPRDARPSRRPG